MNALKYGVKIWENILSKINYSDYHFPELVETQIKEVKQAEKKGDLFHTAIEYVDVILVADHAIRALGFDTEALILYRLQSRHLGKTGKIEKKYSKLVERVPLSLQATRRRKKAAGEK
ncbi:MAG: hypothetical protein ACRDF4_12185 [Rhabdochlamydiaceae bacterium]